MRKSIILFLAIMTGFSFACAQSRTTLLQHINDIKNQTDVYFWNQYTCPDADSAKVNATRRLLIDVNLNRSEQDKVTIQELMARTGYINMDRGNLKQCFAYIKRDEAALLKSGMPTAPAVSQPAPVAPASTYTPPVAERPAARAFIPEAFVQRVMATRYFLDVYKLLKDLKAEGQILQFGKLRDVEDYSSFELILFDMQSQEVITMLSPANKAGKRTNMVNGTEDSLDNYPMSMTAVIWYIK